MRMCIAIPNREKGFDINASPANKTSPGAFAPELVLCTSIRIDTYWGLVVLSVPDGFRSSCLPITNDSYCSHGGAPQHHPYDFIIGRSCVIFMNDYRELLRA